MQRRASHYGPVARPPTSAALAEAAEALRRLLAAIEAGEIDAHGPRAVALKRRLEGAVVAWEEASRQGGDMGGPREAS